MYGGYFVSNSEEVSSIQTQKSLQSIKYQQCSICCEKKIRGQAQIDKYRLPDICYQCWVSHVKNFVLRISYKVGDDVISPFSQGTSIDIIKCINSLYPQDAKEIQEILFKKYSSFNKEIEKCPSESCDFVYVGAKCKWGSNQNIYNCPKCQMPLTTNKAFTLKSFMAAFYLIMANKCPKCDIPIQKISGCPHMTCPCGHHFCWYCYKDHPSGVLKRVYPLHQIAECVFIFFSKIVLFLICCISLLITFNGNWILKYFLDIWLIILSVVYRALILDSAILIQVMFFMMRKRQRYPIRPSFSNKGIAILVLLNLFGIFLLYLLDQFEFFATILIGELILATIGYYIGYAVIFSIQTWFQFIA